MHVSNVSDVSVHLQLGPEKAPQTCFTSMWKWESSRPVDTIGYYLVVVARVLYTIGVLLLDRSVKSVTGSIGLNYR